MKILIISEFIAPVNALASIRWTKLAKYLKLNHGYEIDVLTNSKSYDPSDYLETTYKYDKTLAEDLWAFDNVFEFKNNLIVKSTNLVRNFLKKQQEQINKRRNSRAQQKPKAPIQTLPQDSTNTKASKIDACYDLYLKMRESSFVKAAVESDIDWSEYDVIISTYGPKWTHLAAREIKKTNPGVRWIADYRDPVAYSLRTMTEANINFAKEYTKDAACIITVVPLEYMAMNIADDQRCETVSNGFDGNELAQRTRIKSEHFIIAYTGTLYSDGAAKRDLQPLLRALNELIDEEKIDKDDVDFVYCGPSEDVFLSQVAPFPHINWTNRGMVSRNESLTLQNESSLLVLSTWNTEYERGVVTGKVFEYFASKVPIVCICSGTIPNSLSKKMIETSNAGTCYEEANTETDYPRLKKYLTEKYLEWKTKGITAYTPNREYIDSFDHSNLSHQIDKIIRSL